MLTANVMGPTWGPSVADGTQVGPMLAPWTMLSAKIYSSLSNKAVSGCREIFRKCVGYPQLFLHRKTYFADVHMRRSVSISKTINDSTVSICSTTYMNGIWTLNIIAIHCVYQKVNLNGCAAYVGFVSFRAQCSLSPTKTRKHPWDIKFI